MKRCFQLASLGKGLVKSNPMVGAVLVYNDSIIGEGYHRQFGEAHAEVNCIRSVAPEHLHLIPGSTMYVSLEPCIHFGKTPPCAGLIIQSAIREVVIACSDPFEQVNGGGIRLLKDTGIKVVTPYLREQALELNKRFFTFHTKHRPHIILKWAQSQDKKIAFNGERYKISGNLTDALVHRWRSEEGAILVGTNTALLDNPSLTTRHWQGDNPLRLVIDKNLKLSADSVLLSDDEPLVIFNEIEGKQVGNKVYHQCAPGNMIREVLSFLCRHNIISLIVEGGTTLLQSFIDAGLWDEARVITNRSLQIDAGVEAPSLVGAVVEASMEMMHDEIKFLRNPYSL